MQLSKLLLGLLVIISFILCVGGFLGETGRPSLADEASAPQPVSYSPMDAISSPSGSVARTEKIQNGLLSRGWWMHEKFRLLYRIL